MEKTMYCIIYKITNKINSKIYIGAHKTKNLDDGYMGSGKYLKSSIKKHGLDNFYKKVLFVFETVESMYAKEAELVNEEFLAEANTYNLKLGGQGGWGYANLNYSYDTRVRAADAANLVIGEKYQSDPIFKEKMSKMATDRNNKRVRNGEKLFGDKRHTFKGISHSSISKKIIGEKAAISQLGAGNSQFGTMWITNGIHSMKIKNNCDIPIGYHKGRKMKILAAESDQ